MAESDDNRKKDIARAEEEISLLFVGNDDKNLGTTFAFLEKRGWKYKFVASMKEAFQEITLTRPSHVLVSWNLTSTNVPKAEKALTRGFKIPCIVYTEKDLDAKKQHALAASGVKNYLVAPISGTSVHVKIRALIHEKLTAEADPDIGKKMKAIIVKGEGSNIIKDEKISIKIGLEDEVKSILDYMPKEAEWEKHGTAPDGTPLWKLKKKGAGKDDKNFFVFKGPVPPKMENNTWKMPEEGGSFQQVEPGYKNNANRRVELRNMVEYDENGVLIPDKYQMKTTVSKSVTAMGTAKKNLKPKSYNPQVKLEKISEEEQKKAKMFFVPTPPGMADKLRKDQSEIVKQKKTEEAAAFAAAQKKKDEGQVMIEMLPPKDGGAKINKAVIFKGARTDQNLKSAADQLNGKGTKKTQHQMFADNKNDKPKIKNMMSQLQAQKKSIQQSKPPVTAIAKPKIQGGKTAKVGAVLPIKPGAKIGVTPGMKVSGLSAKKMTSKIGGGVKTAKPSHVKFDGAKNKKAQLVSQDKVQMKQGSKVKGALMDAQKQKPAMLYMPKKSAEEVKKAIENIKVEIKMEKAAISMPEMPKKQKLAKYTPPVQEKVEREVKVPQVKIERLPPKVKATSPLTAPRKPKPEKVAVERQEKARSPKEKIVVGKKEKVKPDKKQEKIEETKTEFHESKTRVFGKRKDTVLATKVARAADNALDHSKEVERIPLTMVTHVDCIPINSKGFSGLLIMATSAPRHCGPQFSRQIKAEMLKLMSSSGEKMKDEGELELVVPPFNFVEVTSEIADFVTITEHDGVELGTAFIPCKDVIPTMGEANSQNMIEVALDKLKPGEKLGFDAYIHMPLNQKYLRYVKQGGTLEESQLKNMTDFKVSQLFVKGDEVRTVKSHFASSFVEKVIRDFLDAVKKSA